MDVKTGVKKFFVGDLTRAFVVRRLLPLLLCLFFGGILLSNLWYPGPYDWRYLTISELMNPILNPAGRVFLSTAMVLCGILLIPVAGYLYRKLHVICLKTAKTGAFFMLMGNTGLILLGFIPDTDELDPYHQAAAATVACGLIFAFLCSWLIMRKDRQPKYGGKRQFDRRLMVVGIFLMWFVIAGMLLSQGIRFIIYSDLSYTGLDWEAHGLPVLLSIALWEWVFFMAFVGYIALLILMVPETVQPLESRPSAPA